MVRRADEQLGEIKGCFAVTMSDCISSSICLGQVVLTRPVLEKSFITSPEHNFARDLLVQVLSLAKLRKVVPATFAQHPTSARRT